MRINISIRYVIVIQKREYACIAFLCHTQRSTFHTETHEAKSKVHHAFHRCMSNRIRCI
jgi:hypothetical protein